MQIREVMTEELATVPPTASLRSAIGRMLKHRVGSVIVVDEALVGIITRSDVLGTIYQDQTSLTEVPVQQAMTSDVVTTQPTNTVASALRTMAANRVKRLPVRDGMNVVGIITLTDIAYHQSDRVKEVRRELGRRDEWTD